MSYHPIQKHILLDLARGGRMKYSELKIKDVENDLFNYHLQYLVKQGLVEKDGSGYLITNSGVSSILLVDSQGNEYKGIRASVLVYIINRSVKPIQILIHNKGRRPYIDEIYAGIAGKIKPGETVENAASRKLAEETGLIGKCNYIGTIRKTRINTEGAIDDAFFYVCVCDKWKGELLPSTDFGVNSWGSVEEAYKYQKNLKSSGNLSYRVLEDIIKGDYGNFFYEEQIKVENF